MKRLESLLMVLGFLGVFMQGTANAAPEVQGSAVIRNSGELRGVVDFCGPQGESGTTVFLPGESFYISTDASGQFLFTYVPEGLHDLIIEVDGQSPVSILEVQVIAKSITDLGTIPVCQDSDNDGFTPESDCNDLNPEINPDAVEVCDNVDNNCDGIVDEAGCATCTDGDNDGFFAQAGCGSLVDCDDGNNLVSPGAPEICDGVDNNCDQVVDENFDFDADGFSSCGGDCNDNDVSVNPTAFEFCDGVDNDCDGSVDEGCECVEGDTAECSRQNVNGECFGTETCDPILGFGACDAQEPSPEVCDGLDNNCDGIVDNDVVGVGGPCDGDDSDFCSDGTLVCSGQGWLFCDDPGDNQEICGNGIDDDCDGVTDEGCP